MAPLRPCSSVLSSAGWNSKRTRPGRRPATCSSARSRAARREAESAIDEQLKAVRTRVRAALARLHNAPAPFADGVLCFGVPQLTRLQQAGIDGNGDVASVGSIASAGGALPGQTLYYQLWYRDGGGPCGSTANLSNALRVPWSP